MSAETSETPRLRFDGLYECAHEDYTEFIRFFADSVVVSVSSTGNARQVISWLDHDFENSGKYVVEGSCISFVCVSSYGAVEYKGVLTERGMELKTHSHINGYKSERKYQFVQQ